jgi:hypothetical protein
MHGFLRYNITLIDEVRNAVSFCAHSRNPQLFDSRKDIPFKGRKVSRKMIEILELVKLVIE